MPCPSGTRSRTAQEKVIAQHPCTSELICPGHGVGFMVAQLSHGWQRNYNWVSELFIPTVVPAVRSCSEHMIRHVLPFRKWWVRKLQHLAKNNFSGSKVGCKRISGAYGSSPHQLFFLILAHKSCEHFTSTLIGSQGSTGPSRN